MAANAGKRLLGQVPGLPLEDEVQGTWVLSSGEMQQLQLPQLQQQSDALLQFGALQSVRTRDWSMSAMALPLAPVDAGLGNGSVTENAIPVPQMTTSGSVQWPSAIAGPEMQPTLSSVSSSSSRAVRLLRSQSCPVVANQGPLFAVFFCFCCSSISRSV